jgi:hypothetical protein
MVAGCLRRVGRLEDALLQYREVYRMTPTNMEALRYLAQLSQVGIVAGWACQLHVLLCLLSLEQAGMVAPVHWTTAGACHLTRLPTQEFGLGEDVRKFQSELGRLERMQSAAAAAPSPLGAGLPLGRVTTQRPPTSGGRPGPLAGLPMPPSAAGAAAAASSSHHQRRASGMFAVGL